MMVFLLIPAMNNDRRLHLGFARITSGIDADGVDFNGNLLIFFIFKYPILFVTHAVKPEYKSKFFSDASYENIPTFAFDNSIRSAIRRQTNKKLVRIQVPVFRCVHSLSPRRIPDLLEFVDNEVLVSHQIRVYVSLLHVPFEKVIGIKDDIAAMVLRYVQWRTHVLP
ncbi:hypothetical protein Trydic_g5865 [Trypoxylus dichotomus]